MLDDNLSKFVLRITAPLHIKYLQVVRSLTITQYRLLRPFLFQTGPPYDCHPLDMSTIFVINFFLNYLVQPFVGRFVNTEYQTTKQSVFQEQKR